MNTTHLTQTIQWVTENHVHEGHNLWEEILEVTLDPAHIIAELIFTIVFDGLFVAFAYGVVFKKLILPKLRKDIHTDIDKAHGQSHGKTTPTPCDDTKTQ